MNKLLIVAVVLASLSCMVSAKMITVKIKEGYNSGSDQSFEKFEVDDEVTVRDLAYRAMREMGCGSINDDVRLENLLMIKFPMDMKLKHVGIHDGSRLVLKYWGRMEDLGANTLVRLIPLGQN